MERLRITELLDKNILDLSSARILLVGEQQVPPQQSVLWLEHHRVASPIWEPLPAGLVVLSSMVAQVRLPQSWASALPGIGWP